MIAGNKTGSPTRMAWRSIEEQADVRGQLRQLRRYEPGKERWRRWRAPAAGTHPVGQFFPRLHYRVSRCKPTATWRRCARSRAQDAAELARPHGRGRSSGRSTSPTMAATPCWCSKLPTTATSAPIAVIKGPQHATSRIPPASSWTKKQRDCGGQYGQPLGYGYPLDCERRRGAAARDPRRARRTAALQIGNPGAVAYDTKRDEILVPN